MTWCFSQCMLINTFSHCLTLKVIFLFKLLRLFLKEQSDILRKAIKDWLALSLYAKLSYANTSLVTRVVLNILLMHS